MRYKLSNDFIKFEADSLGAEPMSIQTIYDPIEFLWQGDARYWGRRSPTLFPIVGSIKNNRYTLYGKEYEIEPHGFARDSEFEMIEATDNRLTFLLKGNRQTLKKFPFPFELYNTYRLEEHSVLIGHSVVNTGNEIMWFSIGEHPAFNCPLLEGETMEDYTLVFDQEESLERRFLENSLLTEKKEPFLSDEKTVKLSESLFKRRAIILENFKSGSMAMVSKNHPRKVTVTLGGYPYLGIWSPATGAPLVCIEPWYGVASPEDSDGDITHKPGILSLEAGERFHCGYSIIID
ncbi:MAG: aldose 1-epimerase family protein [Syntrophales bacterium LBB04]|nr:aldose 1-epimerase family protein [Syntrophales bacterium LBB04]